MTGWDRLQAVLQRCSPLLPAATAFALLTLAACDSFQPLGEDLLNGGPTRIAPPSTTVAGAKPLSPQSLVKTPTTEILPPADVAPAVVQRGAAPALASPGSATANPAITPGNDVTLNFAGADIRDVAHVVLGDILGLNYTIDSTVQGTVTVQTSHPIPRDAVLPTLQQVFRASGAAIVQQNNLIRVVPLQAAGKGTAPDGSGVVGGGTATGSGIQVVPLQFASAADLQRILSPFVPAGVSLQADPTHNILLFSGAASDIQSLRDLVRTFDVDWLAHTSFALVPLRAVSAQTIATEMSNIVSGQQGGPNQQAALRILPIERLNAVLIITSQPRYLDWARNWIQRLDEGSEDDTQRTYVYHVQHGRAADLADVLNNVFGTSRGSSSANSSAPPPPSLTGTTSSGSTSTGAFGGASTDTGTGMGLGSGLGSGTTSGTSGIASGSGVTSSSGMLAPLGSGTLPGDQSAGAVTPPSSVSGDSSSGSSGQNPAAPVRIVTDNRNNALVIVTTPRVYRQIDEALHRLDIEPMQVVIDATIAEVTLNNELQYGLQWFFRQHDNSFAFTNVATATPTSVFPGFSYAFAGSNIQVVLNALSSITTVDVVSAPELLVLNNQTAQLQVGASVPVPVQQAQSVVTAGAPLINTISYLDTGVILRVTPRANANGEVTLDIEQEVSDPTTTTTSGIEAPTINERRIKSSVAIQSGESIALGGLISTNKNLTRTAIPVLGDIPVLGALFRNDNDTRMRTELLVLIQPRVIASSTDAVAATHDLINRMQYVQPFDPTKH